MQSTFDQNPTHQTTIVSASVRQKSSRAQITAGKKLHLFWSYCYLTGNWSRHIKASFINPCSWYRIQELLWLIYYYIKLKLFYLSSKDLWLGNAAEQELPPLEFRRQSSAGLLTPFFKFAVRRGKWKTNRPAQQSSELGRHIVRRIILSPVLLSA